MKKDLLHGGALDAMRKAFPGAPEPWIDLSTGINPWYYQDTQINEAILHRLPTQSMMLDCKSAMASVFGAPVDSLLLAPGSELLIRLLPGVIAPRRIILFAPMYGDHKQVWCAAGSNVIETSDPLSQIERADMIVLCNPGNPDGRVFNKQQIEMARRRLADRGGWLVVDEAYADLDPALSSAPSGGSDGLIVLRSFGKFFGLAGVRLGALVAPPDIISVMSERLGVWPVSGLALEVGTRAYRNHSWQIKTRRRLKLARRRLDSILGEHALTVCGGTDLFCYVESRDAYRLWEHLAGAGIYVRRFPHSDRHLRFGLPPDNAAERRLSATLAF